MAQRAEARSLLARHFRTYALSLYRGIKGESPDNVSVDERGGAEARFDGERLIDDPSSLGKGKGKEAWRGSILNASLASLAVIFTQRLDSVSPPPPRQKKRCTRGRCSTGN